MRSDLPRLLTTFAALALGLPSQNTTVPAVMQGVEGGGGTIVPFGSNSACRIQCIYDAVELPWSGPRLINGISLRADNGTPTSPLAALTGQPGIAIASKQFLDVSVFISTTYATAATASGTFAENHGTDVTEVVRYARIALPAQPVQAAGPRAANLDFTFATPWFFGLTPARPGEPPPGNLLIELIVHAQPSGAYRLDNLGGCAALSADFGQQGPACTVPGVTGQPTLSGDSTMLTGNNFTWTIANGPPNAAYFLMLDITNQGFLGGNPAWPLPYPLFDPANPSQPSPGLAALRFSAPDCWLNVLPAASFFGICNTTGGALVTTMLPPGRQFVGTTFFGQAFLTAPTANMLQLVTTQGRRSTICGPLGVTRVYAFYNGTGTPPPSPPAGGSVQYGSAMVLEVR